MHWYKKLNSYFPIEEMKSREHMETLLKEKSDVYHKDEGKYHVLMYVEFPDFIFIDYIYVSKESRGQGIGHKLISKLKKKGKPIILEVEPLDYEDSDTEKRLRFYKREEFKHAKRIGYRRRSLATDKINKMEILYWAPHHQPEEKVYEAVKRTYERIHTYKDEQFYGKSYEPVEKVVTYEKNKQEDLLEPIK